MPDIAINAQAVIAAGTGYTVPGSQEILVKSIRASFNGAAAAGSFRPLLQVVDPGGVVVAECDVGTTLAAGASADCSWFPGVRPPAGAALTTKNTGGTVTVDPTAELLIGTGLTLTNPGGAGTAEIAGSGGGGVTPWPAADQTDASIDTTTWADNIEGSGFYTALRFPSTDVTYAAFAMGAAGDAFPRVVIGSSMGPDAPVAGGITMGEGSIDPSGLNGVWYAINETKGTGSASINIGSLGQTLLGGGIDANSGFGVLDVFNGLELVATQLNAGRGSMIHYAGYGVPTIGGNLHDKYWRWDGGAGSFLYTCTGAGRPGVATWAAIL